MIENNKDIKKTIGTIIADQLGISQDKIEYNKSLEDLGADSIDRVEIIMKLEESFNIEISENASDKLKSVNEFADYIKEQN